MDGILKHSDFQLRLPSKIECQLILEALNEASKECTYKHVHYMNGLFGFQHWHIDLNFCLVNQLTPLNPLPEPGYSIISSGCILAI